MTKKQRVDFICGALEKEYPLADCSLTVYNPLQLLLATRLSAQCTDKRVNMVTPVLFERFPDAAAFAAADIADIEEIIKPCGLYKTKAKDLKAACTTLQEKFGGQVPGTMEELLSLSGVGRKTANLVLGEVFGKPAIIADTHCIRLSNRLSLCDTTDPYKVEMALKAILPPEKSTAFCHRLVHHGRAVCTARKPNCDACCLKSVCKNAKETL